MRKTNFNEVEDMRESLGRIKRLTLENFIMPEDDERDDDNVEDIDDDMSDDDVNDIDDNEELGEMGNMSEDVKQAIMQIRKVAINTIAKLANDPTTEGYTFMKRVFDMSDKAMEKIYENKKD